MRFKLVAQDLDLVHICYDGSLATLEECVKQMHKKTDSEKLHFLDNLKDIPLIGQLQGGKY